MTVIPFILRAVKLLGIDSAMTPMGTRVAIWARLAGDLKPRSLESIRHTIDLAGLPDAFNTLLRGAARGRYVVRLS
jgi:hypothetical protein